MNTITKGRPAPLTPDERLNLLPFVASRSSLPLGWSGLRADHFPLQPGGDVTTPPLDSLLIVLEGDDRPQAQVRCGDEAFDGPVPPATVSLIPPGVQTRHAWQGNSSSTHFHLSTTLVSRVAVEAFDRDATSIHLPVVLCGIIAPHAYTALTGIRDELLGGGPGGRLCAESLAAVLVVHLIRHLASGPPVRGLTGVLARPALKSVEEYVEDNLDRNIGLADLAAVAHLSEYHFARLFKAATGQTPHQFVIARRVERAKELIRGRRLSLAQVAAACGFTDQSGFTKHFKRAVGVTPKQFG